MLTKRRIIPKCPTVRTACSPFENDKDHKVFCLRVRVKVGDRVSGTTAVKSKRQK